MQAHLRGDTMACYNSAMPTFTRPIPTGKPRKLFGGELIADVPATVVVSPSPSDADPLDFECELTIDVVGNQLTCVELKAWPHGGNRDLTGEMLRRVPIERYVREVAQDDLVLERTAEGHWRDYVPPPSDFAAGGLSDEVLRQVARVYRYATVTRKRPFGVLERDYGIAGGKAARWLATARRRGILIEDEE